MAILVAKQNELIEAINACERRLKSGFSRVRWLFFEPDIAEPPVG
jgi:hypothetical protein